MQLQKEISSLRLKVISDTSLVEALTRLELAIVQKNKTSIRDTIKEYAREFSLTLFTGAASQALLNFIQTMG